ncbi:MAG: NAD(P)/FAD-dependent oxidoreductase [Maricaulis sp.]|uniref:NAD(P)/FAD-dependent oxidoreductase n=1 Tax=Maricaulis sp. TaxID=1486257 RepID=UPI001B029BE4|nr:NAD(P)/FAD-dependent oxidoreductase [Maricaulis sp.]MBO6729663.1 NAD(P)/FAD-dependent oxidoreductase [Maricaulis sp.]MBO6846799.1 NAD(P)/FAD-dependent oxidoreductase [Maricaulis sp.]MBO6877555.1 NAD(P)/FAD-dependent oxidoreductase [Maricaulis sp.]
MQPVDVAIIGAGAAGLFCAIEAGKRGRSVAVIEHSKAPAEKIRISGGGRCNFTNLHAEPSNYLSDNPHFVKSALKRYTQYDFIDWVDGHGIAWHEKTLGQLFCDVSAKLIIEALVDELNTASGQLHLNTAVSTVEREGDGFRLTLNDGTGLSCQSLVIATGGKSIPKMGATGFAYDIARQFGLGVTETRPALVPLTFSGERLDQFKSLAGVACDTRTGNARKSFNEAMLFTHRGLSGPAILQISSYWREGEDIYVHLRPELDWFAELDAFKTAHGGQGLAKALAQHLPDRLAQALNAEIDAPGKLAETSSKRLREIAETLSGWALTPSGSEGYRTAEVTLGGVDTHDLDSKTMSARSHGNLYFIGEAVDVTGWLGGYNFQWAWSSGWVAGQCA